LDSDILVGNLGPNKEIANICTKYGAKVKNISLEDNYGEARNKLLRISKTHWNFYIEPWEILINGHEQIKKMIDTQDPTSCYLQILQGRTITKEIRLWNKRFMFDGLVFENILDDKAIYLEDSIIYSLGSPDNTGEQMQLIELWKRNRITSFEPYYYQANILLKQKKFREFIGSAEYYLFNQKHGMSSIMMRYYLAMVYLLVMGDASIATKYILECLAVRPLMAEFWCLLGDIFYKASQFAKSQRFYENAMFLGAKRLPNDAWPMEIVKYKEYPSKMIESCKKIIEHIQSIAKPH
jgi:tetratricopeptide (TPR) repeat protein